MSLVTKLKKQVTLSPHLFKGSRMQHAHHRSSHFGRLALIFAVLALVLYALSQLAGCTSLGLASASNLDQRIAYADSVSTSALQALQSGVENGSISPAQATQLNDRIVAANQLLDAARAAESTNPQGAQSNLATALAALSAVQSILQSAAVNGAKP